MVVAEVAAGRTAGARSYDAMIAAIAVAHDLALDTADPDDFTGIERLEVRLGAPN